MITITITITIRPITISHYYYHSIIYVSWYDYSMLHATDTQTPGCWRAAGALLKNKQQGAAAPRCIEEEDVVLLV